MLWFFWFRVLCFFSYFLMTRIIFKYFILKLLHTVAHVKRSPLWYNRSLSPGWETLMLNHWLVESASFRRWLLQFVTPDYCADCTDAVLNLVKVALFLNTVGNDRVWMFLEISNQCVCVFWNIYTQWSYTWQPYNFSFCLFERQCGCSYLRAPCEGLCGYKEWAVNSQLCQHPQNLPRAPIRPVCMVHISAPLLC